VCHRAEGARARARARARSWRRFRRRLVGNCLKDEKQEFVGNEGQRRLVAQRAYLGELEHELPKVCRGVGVPLERPVPLCTDTYTHANRELSMDRHGSCAAAAGRTIGFDEVHDCSRESKLLVRLDALVLLR